MTQPHYFVSYSRADAADFAVTLADKLQAGPPSYRAWVDSREIQPGQDWDDQILAAIQGCVGLLFVMTADSVRQGSGCKPEWVSALRYKKPVIPVRLHADAELPLRLSSRQFVDFSSGFDDGLARLRGHLSWVASPAGVLQELCDRLADAERELPRSDASQRPRIEREIELLTRRVGEQQRLVADPEGARELAQARIDAGLERQRQPVRPVVAETRARFVNPPPMTAPDYFQGRRDETAIVGEFLRSDAKRMLSIVGRGGVGKTALACRLLKSLERGRLPDDLGELTVDGIVYLSPVGARSVSFRNIFTGLCRLLAPDVAEPLVDRLGNPHETPSALMLGLLEAFPSGRTVLFLDNFEDLLDPASLKVTDHELDEGLRTLLGAPAHGVKVILTSRIAPRQLMLTQPAVQRRLDLGAGLVSPHAEQILRAMDPDGSLGLRDAPDALLAQARARTGGFPRALEALAAILSADRDTTLAELLDGAEQLPPNVVEAYVGEAFNRLDPLAQRVMQALAIFTEPVPPVAVDYLLQPFEPAIDTAPALGRLVNMHFARRDGGRYYLHQVDRDYALARIDPGAPADRTRRPPPFTQFGLRGRGADYFKQTRSPRESWHTLDDLAPQLSEFELRWAAADYDAAAEVLRAIDRDYLALWGHYRLAISLHERLHGRLADAWQIEVSKALQAWSCVSVGETRHAIELYEEALVLARARGSRANEAAWLDGLATCHVHLGDTSNAIELTEASLKLAREIRNEGQEGMSLGNLGNRFCELGAFRRAMELHTAALIIHRRTGDRYGESMCVDNLGTYYQLMGESRLAVERYDEALALCRRTGDRYCEAVVVGNLGDAYADLGDVERARRDCEQAIRIADEIGHIQARTDSRLVLAKVHLQAGDFASADELANAARRLGYPPAAGDLALVHGIALARLGRADDARPAFAAALTAAEALLAFTAERYGALDTKALALCGLALVEDADRLDEAKAAFDAARAITAAAGVVRDVLRLFDALAGADDGGVLAPLRRHAEGVADG